MTAKFTKEHEQFFLPMPKNAMYPRCQQCGFRIKSPLHFDGPHHREGKNRHWGTKVKRR